MRAALRRASESRLGLIFLSIDAIAGIAVGTGVAVSAALVPRLRETQILDLSALVSVAILAVVIAAFAILVALLDDEYTLVVKETFGDARAAFEPYAAVAIVSGLAIFISGGGIFVWKVAPGWLLAVLMGCATGLATWSVIGTIQLVGITITHGRHRAKVPEIRASFEKAQREKGKGRGIHRT